MINNSDRSQNFNQRSNDLAGVRYPRLTEISVSSSNFDSGIWNQFQTHRTNQKLIAQDTTKSDTNRSFWRSVWDSGGLDDTSCGDIGNDVRTSHSSQQKIKRCIVVFVWSKTKQWPKSGYVTCIAIPPKVPARVKGLDDKSKEKWSLLQRWDDIPQQCSTSKSRTYLWRGEYNVIWTKGLVCLKKVQRWHKYRLQQFFAAKKWWFRVCVFVKF